MSNVINFDDHAADLHLSEWAAFITDVSADFAKVAAAHEAHPTPATKDGALEYLYRIESLIGAARRVLNKGGPNS